MLHLVENARRKQITWVRSIMDQTGWSQTELARRAGITHATLSKFFNDPDNRAELATSTIGKLAAVSPIPHYENVRGALPQGFDAHEAERFEAGDDDYLARAVASLRHGRNDLEAWTLRTDALENAGYREGDVLIVDAAALPQPGDVVCARIYDLQGKAETAFRLYHRPYLVAASNARRHLAPTLLDERVEIAGVVIASLRPRQSRLAS